MTHYYSEDQLSSIMTIIGNGVTTPTESSEYKGSTNVVETTNDNNETTEVITIVFRRI